MRENKDDFMKALLIGIIMTLIFMAFVYYLNSHVFMTGTWRYKITVEVETPEGIKAGSAVREISVQRGISLTPEMTAQVNFKGEAVVVDLGERGILFALLTSAKTIPFYTFPSGVGYTTVEGIDYYRHLKAGPKELGAREYPMFVRFRDLQDPKTVGRVVHSDSLKNSILKFDPNYPVDTFEEAFGKDVKLKSIFIEMTDEPAVVENVVKILPWFLNRQLYTAGYIGGNQFYDPTKTWLTSVNFVQTRK